MPDLIEALAERPNLVLIAPPGAGKTTAVAPALLTEPWCSGKILLLSPRRLAARAAAERMAELAGEPVGKTIGYATRMDSKQSPATRVLVLTEGIFRNRIQADPELAGVSAVLFDEVHERSLDSDFGLALALDAQSALRPDLRLIAMSATLDGNRFAAIMNAPVIESEGRAYPLTLRHIGKRTEARIEDQMASAIRTAMSENDGDCLAFVPGVGEIERVAERLSGLAGDIIVHKLHGSLDPADQRAAIAAAAPGKRKLIIATSIAETSLTIDGVRIVVDSGLARRPRYDRAAGMTRLVTERASQAAVTQRAGRAARQAPGIAYRLWEQAATEGLPRFDPPEILEADLSALTLDCALWGVSDPASLTWIDPPPTPALAEARTRLMSIGALDEDARPTPHGKAIAALPLPPRLAHMIVRAGDLGIGVAAAEVAVLLSERGLGGNDVDLEVRLNRWRGERGKRADAARGLAKGWLHLLASRSRAALGVGGVSTAIALAFPDRIARRRGASGEAWVSVGGRGFSLDPSSHLAKSEWLAVAETQGQAAGARIISAAAIEFAEIETMFAERIETICSVSFDPATDRISAMRHRRLGAIILASGNDSDANTEEIAAAMMAAVRTYGLSIIAWSDTANALRMRAAFAGIDVVNDASLIEQLDEWLMPLLSDKRRFADVRGITAALEALIGWDGMKRINALAPSHFISPAGTRHPIDYGSESGPRIELRVQALFGVSEHPLIGTHRIPLILSLTSPRGTPIQTTRDLPGFWVGSWADVAKDMRGAYPKHNWPDNPMSAVASLKTKKAQARP